MLPYLTGKEAECAELITDVKKAKFTLEQPTKAKRWSGGKALLFIQPQREVSTTSRPL